MASTLRDVGGGKAKMRCYWTYGEWGVASVLDIQSLFFFEENWICAMTKHLAESSNINILFTTNFPFDSDVRQWIQPLIIPLHCLRTKSTNRTRVTRLGGEGVCLKVGCSRSRGNFRTFEISFEISDVYGQGGGCLEIQTIFMDVI